MTDTAPNYRIWQSPESVLIQHESGWVEMSITDALRLAAEITARLGSPGSVQWTPERSAECVRLYIDEGLGSDRIGKRIGVSPQTIKNWLKKAGVQMRQRNTGLAEAHAALAAKRAANRAA